ncbi:hypothetical protein TNCV_301451 [Trichonephila clavipes]|nr:hypothetical protein TNCV_301451 [Trichonephila clavipes]
MYSLTASGDVWMVTKSVVSVAAIFGYNHCLTPRHRIRLWIYSWGTAVSMRLPHIAKVDLVWQQVVYLRTVIVQGWTTRFQLAINRKNEQAKEAIQFDE